jgi:hypothetical protein
MQNQQAKDRSQTKAAIETSSQTLGQTDNVQM